MAKIRVWAGLLLVFGLGIGYFDYYSGVVPVGTSFSKPFKLGLDLRGGSQLTYRADVSKIDETQIGEAMSSLRTVIERRVNSVGLTEALVQTEQTSLGQKEHRLIIEIPGVMDVNEAVKLINKTPVLEFQVERPEGAEKDAIIKAQKDLIAKLEASGTTTEAVSAEILKNADPLALENPEFMPSGLTGQYLKRASVRIDQGGAGSLGPTISLEFNAEGGKKFAEITKNNVGKKVGIFLDGEKISDPVVNEPILDGQAEISGQFTLQEAKELVRDLNLGALPVPVELISTQTVGATLGQEAYGKGVKTTMLGFLVIAIFMIIWYRLPGIISIVSLSIYLFIMIALFKLIPITMTAGGIAGLILSIGIAVDANVLIFERMKEEMRRGKSIHNSILDGFSRAWTSIRDSNFSTIISASILYWFGTAMIKGFSLNLIIGVTISMFTAVVLSRTFLLAVSPSDSAFSRFIFSSGFTSGKTKTVKSPSEL